MGDRLQDPWGFLAMSHIAGHIKLRKVALGMMVEAFLYPTGTETHSSPSSLLNAGWVLSSPRSSGLHGRAGLGQSQDQRGVPCEWFSHPPPATTDSTQNQETGDVPEAGRWHAETQKRAHATPWTGALERCVW